MSRGISELLMTADDGLNVRKGHLKNGMVLVAFISTMLTLKKHRSFYVSSFHFLVVKTCGQN